MSLPARPSVQAHGPRPCEAPDEWASSHSSPQRTDYGLCWLWTGPVNDHGYGLTKFMGERSAHRASFRWFIGPLPLRHDVDHLCGMRSCINPAHLRAVPHRENVLASSHPNMVAHRERRCKHGHLIAGDNATPGLRPRCRACMKVYRWNYDVSRHRAKLLAAEREHAQQKEATA